MSLCAASGKKIFLWMDFETYLLCHCFIFILESHAGQVHHHKGLRLDHVNQSLMPSIQKEPEPINMAVERRDKGEVMVKKLLSFFFFSRIFFVVVEYSSFTILC